MPDTGQSYNVLFVAGENPARSVMAEALLNDMGRGRFRAYSAGTRPVRAPDPLAIEVLKAHGHRIEGLRSRSCDEFAGPDAPGVDLVVTVSADAAGEARRAWPGRPVTAHWGFDDPSAVESSEAQKRAHFESVYRQIAARLRILVSFSNERLIRMSAHERARETHAPSR